MRKLLASACGVVAMAFTMALPAQGAPLEREHYSGTDSFDFDDCGPLVHNEVTSSGVFMLKAPTKPGAPPRYFDNYEVHEVLTANGRTMTVDHNGLYKDLHATLVSGTTYRFVAQESGQPFVARRRHGRAALQRPRSPEDRLRRRHQGRQRSRQRRLRRWKLRAPGRPRPSPGLLCRLL